MRRPSADRGDNHASGRHILKRKGIDAVTAIRQPHLNNRGENSHQPLRRREKIMKRFRSPEHLQRFASIHDPIANLFHLPRFEMTSGEFRDLRSDAMKMWQEIAQIKVV